MLCFLWNRILKLKEEILFRTNVNEHLDISVHNVPFGQSMKSELIKKSYNTNREENPGYNIPEFKEVVPIEVNVDAILEAQVDFSIKLRKWVY